MGFCQYSGLNEDFKTILFSESGLCDELHYVSVSSFCE